MASLLDAYIAKEHDLLPFYNGSPESLLTDPPKTRPWAPELVADMKAFNESLGVSARFDGAEAVVVTGQQPALFGGPMYTIYKAITTLLLAERIQERHGVRCVPVYWVGSDDHDFEEARTAHFLSKNHTPLSLQYAPDLNVDGFPMYRLPLDGAVHAFVDQAAAMTAGSEFAADIRAFLHEALDESSSLSEWSTRILARTFRETPLVFFAPHIPKARRLAVEIIEREIDAPLETTVLLNAAGAELDAKGFDQQVQKAENECNFFMEWNGRRRKVVFDGKRFVVPEEDASIAPGDLHKTLHAEPERFSPNVALRCVLQQHLFPAAAYVAGPGELAYWGQLKPVFDRFALEMPIVYPRVRACLSNIKVNKLMDKFGLSLDDLYQPVDRIEEKAFQSTQKNPAFDIIQQERSKLEGAAEAFAQSIAPHDKQVYNLAEGLLKEIANRLDAMERAALRGDKNQAQTVQTQVARIVNTLAPFRKPQERVYCVASYLFGEGWGLAPRLMKELDVTNFNVQEVEL